MKLPSGRIRLEEYQEMFATKAQRHEKFLLCYSFLVSWCLSGEKKVLPQKTQK